MRRRQSSWCSVWLWSVPVLFLASGSATSLFRHWTLAATELLFHSCGLLFVCVSRADLEGFLERCHVSGEDMISAFSFPKADQEVFPDEQNRADLGMQHEKNKTKIFYIYNTIQEFGATDSFLHWIPLQAVLWNNSLECSAIIMRKSVKMRSTSIGILWCLLKNISNV